MQNKDKPKKLNWLLRLFRKRVRLTYWINNKEHIEDICWFQEKDKNCIIFKDYYTKLTTVVKHHVPINYKLEQQK